MSRIGKKEIKIPEGVTLTLLDNYVSVEGKNGALEQTFLKLVSLKKKGDELFVLRADDTKESKEYHGLVRVLIQNMIIGVDSLFKKTLVMEGVGYKFQLDESFIIINAGFTHQIKLNIFPDIKLKLESPLRLTVLGISKEKVGLFASKIRNIRPPEPYKGKGILYEGELIRRKPGKTGK